MADEALAETFVLRDADLPTGPAFTLMAEAACKTGAVTPGEADAWLAQAVNAAAHGQFLWAATMFAVASQR